MGSRLRVKSPRVLVVDDDANLARVLQQLLQSGGLPVVVVHSFAAARELAEHFAVGVFDIDLGDGCGVELAERMVAEGRVEQVVFFSGAVSPDLLGRARRSGAVLTKGMDTLRLRDHVLALVRSGADESSDESAARAAMGSSPDRHG